MGRSCVKRLEQSAGPEEAGPCLTQLPLTLANTEVILQVSSLFLQPTSPSDLPWSSQFGSCTRMMLPTSWVLSAVGAEYTCVRSPGCCQARQRAQFLRGTPAFPWGKCKIMLARTPRRCHNQNRNQGSPDCCQAELSLGLCVLRETAEGAPDGLTKEGN